MSQDELNTDAEGKGTWSYEIRLLEKINRQQKLLGQSLPIYIKRNEFLVFFPFLE